MVEYQKKKKDILLQFINILCAFIHHHISISIKLVKDNYNIASFTFRFKS